ncbi:MAG: hypothetical protein RSD57_15910 [Comamonas sp.]
MPSQTPLKLTPTSGTTGELREFAAGDFLPLSAGGTGVAAGNTADVRAALGLGSAAVAAILGTVTQSGGVPTGAIIQRGSNANGIFVRFADGTQICCKTVSAPASWTTVGKLWATGLFSLGDWPATFATLEGVANAISGGPMGAFVVSGGTMPNTTVAGSVYICNNEDRGVVTLYVTTTAVGKWF